MGPGGRHAGGKFFNCTGGATGYVDKLLLGTDHVYQYPTATSVYGSGPFDPEGVLGKFPHSLYQYQQKLTFYFILGSLTSIFQVFLGVQAGQILREYKEHKSRVLRWLTWAVVVGLVGAILHFTYVIPVNKNLWYKICDHFDVW